MKSTKRYSFYKIGFLSTALICAMLFSFCGKENTIYSYAYTKAAGTVKPESAKIRSEANTSSESVAGVKQSEKVTIIDETKDSAGNVWYKVEVDNKTGYIRADLVTKEKTEAAAQTTSNKTESTETPKVTETPAEVTASSVSSGTVTEASINVRKGPAATDAVVVNAKSGTVVSITGEAKGADGKTWYQVSFLNNNKEVTGFVRSDLLKTSSESVGEETTETEVAPEGTTEESATQPPVPETPENYSEISNVVGSRIIPEGTDISQMNIDESVLLEWQSGNYYLLYTKGTDGTDSWYLYDVGGNTFQKVENLVPNDSEGETDSTGTILGDKGNVVIIILAVLLIIMIILCTVMFLKVRQYKSYGDEGEDDEEDDEEDEDEDDDEPTRVKRSRWKSRNFLKAEEDNEDEDDEEDDEEEDEEEEEEIPVKRSAKKAPIKKLPQSSKTQVQQPTPKPIPKPTPKPAESTPKYQMDLDEDDDEFEFGFLNMDSKDDL